MRIVFAGTPVFAAKQCEALLKLPHHTVVAVYTQPDKPAGRGRHLQMSPVKALAKQHNIPIEQPSRLTPDTLDTFAAYAPDLMVVAAYGLLLPPAFLAIPRYGCINVHASLLPHWRGAAPIQRAILANDPETGITLMRMDSGLDTGNILAMARTLIGNTTTSEQLHDALATLGATLLRETLNSIVDKPGTPQDKSLATYAPKITKEEGRIRWEDSAAAIARLVRAFNPWPVAFTAYGDGILRIWEASPIEFLIRPGTPPGTIIEHHPQGLVVATGMGALLITQAQLPGKKRLSFSEILHAPHPAFTKGQTLGLG